MPIFNGLPVLVSKFWRGSPRSGLCQTLDLTGLPVLGCSIWPGVDPPEVVLNGIPYGLKSPDYHPPVPYPPPPHTLTPSQICTTTTHPPTSRLCCAPPPLSTHHAPTPRARAPTSPLPLPPPITTHPPAHPLDPSTQPLSRSEMCTDSSLEIPCLPSLLPHPLRLADRYGWWFLPCRLTRWPPMCVRPSMQCTWDQTRATTLTRRSCCRWGQNLARSRYALYIVYSLCAQQLTQPVLDTASTLLLSGDHAARCWPAQCWHDMSLPVGFAVAVQPCPLADRSGACLAVHTCPLLHLLYASDLSTVCPAGCPPGCAPVCCR
jgi:hypothetical protein